MNYAKLSSLREKIYFPADEVARVLGIQPASARVLCSRYARQGLFYRLKRGFFTLAEKWKALTREEFFQVANLLQVPSYISFTTALAYYNLTTQTQRNFWESAARKRTRKFQIEQDEFIYFKLKPELYFGFEKKNGVFIAAPEKAFLDAVYLCSLGRYSLDISALETGKFDRGRLKTWAKRYPGKTQKMVKKICGI